MSLEPGMRLGPTVCEIDRAALVRYAGASGDFNPIHYSDTQAEAVGLPGVIAHGMFTMALVAQAVADWAGDPTALVDLEVRFSRPIPVPAQGAARVEIVGEVGELDEQGLRVTCIVTHDGVKVLGKAVGVLRALARS